MFQLESTCQRIESNKMILPSYGNFTVTSLEIMFNNGNHPQMALIPVSELLQLARKQCHQVEEKTLTPVAGLRWLHMLECYSSPAEQVVFLCNASDIVWRLIHL